MSERAALVLVALLGVSSVREEPPADVAWTVERGAAAAARLAAAFGAFDLLASWRSETGFHYAEWGHIALPAVTVSLVVCGLSIAFVDRRLRLAGPLLALASAGLPLAMRHSGPVSTIAGVGFGAVWIMIGLLRATEPRRQLPELYPQALRGPVG